MADHWRNTARSSCLRRVVVPARGMRAAAAILMIRALVCRGFLRARRAKQKGT